MSRSNKGELFLKVFLILIIILSLSITGILILFQNTSLREKIFNKIQVDEILTNDSSETKIEQRSVKQASNTQTLLQETSKADSSYFDDILFIGDSRTVGLASMGYVNDENVLAKVGLAHKDALDTVFEQEYNSYTIKEYLSYNSPRVIMIAFGINGISYMNQDDFMKDYNYLIDKVMSYSPDSKIVVQSILPIGETMEYKDDRYNNESVMEYNNLIYNMCKEKGIYYMDLYGELIDEDTGYLNSEYDSGDGLHFNKQAYEVIVDYMLRHTI